MVALFDTGKLKDQKKNKKGKKAELTQNQVSPGMSNLCQCMHNCITPNIPSSAELPDLEMISSIVFYFLRLLCHFKDFRMTRNCRY